MNDVPYLCAVSDEEIAEAIEERKREARAVFLALHPECIDAEVASRRAMANNTSVFEELEFLRACERFHAMDGKLTVSVAHLRGKEE